MAKSSRVKKIRDDIEALLDESLFRREGEPSRIYKFIHFWVLVGRSFVRNRCPIRASALSYTTLLALIPMLAVAMSVTTSVLKKQGQEQIEQFIDHFVSSVMPPAVVETNAVSSATNSTAMSTGTNAPVALETNVVTNVAASTNASAIRGEDERVVTAQRKVAEQIYGFVQKAQSGAITGIGAVLLILVAIRMVRSVEATLNDIWGVTRGRSWGMSIAIYWLTISLGPVLLASALGLASGPHIEATREFLLQMPVVGGVVFKFLPVAVLWLTFALLYKALPNTRVRFGAALVGGIVSGTVWHVNNMFGFLYVSRVVSNSRIYGSLGLVPVFMAGIYFSWLIFLFGAQIAYAFQNRSLYLQERLAENVNQRGREFVALRLMTCIGQRYGHGFPPPTVQSMSDELGIPSRLVQQVLQTLIAAHLVREIGGDEASAYVPARPLEGITAHHVLMAMRATPGQELLTREEPVRDEVYGEFARIQEAEKHAASSITILTLVQRAEARLQLTPPPPDDAVKVTPALAGEAKPEPEPAIEVPPPASPPAIAETKTAEPEAEAEPERKFQGASVVVEPASDEERDFPL